jgi:hypothetical protein
VVESYIMTCLSFDKVAMGLHTESDMSCIGGTPVFRFK